MGRVTYQQLISRLQKISSVCRSRKINFEKVSSQAQPNTVDPIVVVERSIFVFLPKRKMWNKRAFVQGGQHDVRNRKRAFVYTSTVFRIGLFVFLFDRSCPRFARYINLVFSPRTKNRDHKFFDVCRATNQKLWQSSVFVSHPAKIDCIS